MSIEEAVKLGAQLVAIAALIGPAVEFAISLIVVILHRVGVMPGPIEKRALAALLSIGGSAALAGGMGLVPWPQVWIPAIFGLAAWLLAHANHKASVAAEEPS